MSRNGDTIREAIADEEGQLDQAYEALVFISDYPNRVTEDVQDDALELAEYAREVLGQIS